MDHDEQHDGSDRPDSTHRSDSAVNGEPETSEAPGASGSTREPGHDAVDATVVASTTAATEVAGSSDADADTVFEEQREVTSLGQRVTRRSVTRRIRRSESTQESRTEEDVEETITEPVPPAAAAVAAASAARSTAHPAPVG